MWRRSAAAGFALAVTLTMVVAAGGPADAATELRLSPASGPPGTEFVVTGTGFAALPVEIRWGGLSGPVIATAMGPAFTVTAVVPDSPPNSHPVMAVVTDGSSVSTSSASFQVTNGDTPAPVDTTTTTEVTTTTVAVAPATTVPEPAAAATTGPATGVSTRADTSGVGGGVDGGTTNGGGVSAPTVGSATPAGSNASSPNTTQPATIPGPTATVAPPPGTGAAPAPAAATAPPGTAPAPTAGATVPADATDAALAPRTTSQSAGAVSNPGLLFLGLALVFGGGVFLAVRNRYRTG